MLPRTGSRALLFTDPVRYFSETYRRAYAEGWAQGTAEAILIVAEARGLCISPWQHARVLDPRDTATLHKWLKRAVTVASAEQLFD